MRLGICCGILLFLCSPVLAADPPAPARPDTVDLTVNVFELPVRHQGVDDRARVSETNPIDPVKDERVIVFGCADGQLEISRTPNDPNRPMSLRWIPDPRHPDVPFLYYRDPLARVGLITDPFRRALAFATYNTVFRRSLGLLGKVGFTAEQAAKELALRQAMNAQIKEIDTSTGAGTFHPEMLAELSKVLDALLTQAGDPSTDKDKAQKARDVLAVASKIGETQNYAKGQHIDAYMDAVEKLLTAEQKQALVKAYSEYVASTRPATRPAADQ